METKQCNKCGQIKPIDSFRKRMSRNGIDYWYEGKCKDCIHIEQKEYFKEKMSNPEYANKRKQDNKKAVIKYYSDDQNRINRNNKENIRYANKPKSCKIYVKECPVTHNLFIARKINAIYSKDGRMIKAREDMRDGGYIKYYYRDGHNIRNCVICNKEYNVLESGTLSYCSNECKKRAKRIINANRHPKDRLKITAAYQYINPIKVFNRDKWHCKLCGVSTPKSMRGTIALNAPELDHIIPLSKGGSHTYTNVQCLCRSCNNIKSDKLIGQLKLCI